jgi:hypothetical protein
MTKFVGAFVVALLLVAAPAYATSFTLNSYDVSVHTNDPGLVLFEVPKLGLPQIFELNTVGQWVSFTLFTLGTNEKALNADDLVPYDISVDFNFTDPTFGGAATGFTGAGWFFGSFGYVEWNNPRILDFGNYGQLAISLENATFPLGGSTDIDVKFTLLRADGGTARVPEPSSALLFGVGALAMGAIRRRRAANQ